MLVTPSSYWSKRPLLLASVVVPSSVVPASIVSIHPSLSESVSKLFGMPSWSVSTEGNASKVKFNPSVPPPRVAVISNSPVLKPR